MLDNPIVILMNGKTLSERIKHEWKPKHIIKDLSMKNVTIVMGVTRTD